MLKKIAAGIAVLGCDTDCFYSPSDCTGIESSDYLVAFADDCWIVFGNDIYC